MTNRVPTDFANKNTAVGADSCFGYDSQAVDNKNITVQAIGDFAMSDNNSDALAEGVTNLYYTTARKNAIASDLMTFTNKTLNADGVGNIITNIGSSEVKSELITGQSTAGIESGDFLMFSDTSDSGNLKKVDVNNLPQPGLNNYTYGATVTAGDPVTLKTNGSIYKWTGYNNAGTEYATGFNISSVKTVYVDTNKIVTAYFDSTNNDISLKAGSISATGVITYGAEVTLDASAAQSEIYAIKVDTNAGVIMYKDASVANAIMVHPFTVSGTVVTAGTRGQVNSITTNALDIFDICLISTNKVYITYTGNGGSARANARVGLIASNNITFGTEVLDWSAGNTVTEVRCCKIDTDKVLTTHIFNGDIRTAVATISGTTITVATGNQVTYVGTCLRHSIYPVSTDKGIIVFDETDIKGMYVTVSSTTPTYQTIRTLVLATVLTTEGKPLIQLNSNLYGIAYTNATVTWFMVNDTTFTMVPIKTIDYRVATGTNVTYTKGIFVPSQEVFGNMIISEPNLASKKTYLINFDSHYLFGIAQQSGVVGESKTVSRNGQISTTNTGLSVGEKTYINSDGTYTLNPTAFGATTGQVAFVGKPLTTTSMLVDLNLEDL